MPNQWFGSFQLNKKALINRLISRAMLHDSEEYPDPHAFRPERFLSTTGERVQRDPMKIAFGFGRR